MYKMKRYFLTAYIICLCSFLIVMKGSKMENYDDTYKTVCRICLKYEKYQNMISLIDTTTQDGLSCHGKAVLTFANISLTKHDCLPAFMCKNCLYCLKQAIYFKLLAERSDKSLRKLVDIVGNSIEKLKEKIVEYTMFKIYFPDNFLYTSQKTRKNCKRSSKTQVKNEPILITDLNTETSLENISNDVEADNVVNQSDSDHSINNGEEILSQMQKIIDSNSFNNIEISRTITRQHLKFKKKLLQRRKKLALKKFNIQRKNKNFICNICNKVLANQFTYEHHMQRHNGCRYICEHCGKGFPVQTELNIHQVARHGIGPHLQCSHCPFKAPRKFELIEHERLHSGERPYTCDKCGLTFRRRAIWKKHLIYHTEKKIQCPQCPKKFFQRSEMLAHANSIHDRVYVYLCNKCGVTYARTATVRRHLTERHGIPREMQGKIIRVNKGVGYQEQ